MRTKITVVILALSLSGCVPLVAAGWAHHDYDYHCYNPHHKPAKWCRDHK
jgi:hypothetical protein